MRIFGTLANVDESTRSVEIIASTPNPVDGEALLTWDLERFRKNPVILWSHFDCELPVGRADEPSIRVETDGLKMRVFFATEEANPQAERVFQSVKQGTVRTVSVGYEPGKKTAATIDGEKVDTFTANELLEVSFVSVPADEDAGIISASQAASVLSRSKRSIRTDANDEKTVLHFDAGGRLGKAVRTSLGGAKIPARFTRTGILVYRNPDGTQRRELRTDAEVFHPDSLASLEDVPVVDFDAHVKIHRVADFRKVARGHLKTFRRDGNFVAGDVVVQDEEVLGKIDRGELVDISMGYECKLDFSPGLHEGQPYDCIQRGIRYNHVALCPPNRGRAGSEVGLRLDVNTWETSHFDQEEIVMKMIRLDGIDFEVGSDAHLGKLDAMHKGELDALQKKLDAADGAADQAKDEARKLRDQIDGDKKTADDERKKRDDATNDQIRNRVRLYRTALRLLDTGVEDPDVGVNVQVEAAAPDENDPDGEPEVGVKVTDQDGDPLDEQRKRAKRGLDLEKKMDAMSDREIMLLAITAHSKGFDGKGKSDDYVRSRFDALEESVKKTRGVAGVVRAAKFHEQHLDASEENGGKSLISVMEEARKKRDADMRSAHLKKTGGK